MAAASILMRFERCCAATNKRWWWWWWGGGGYGCRKNESHQRGTLHNRQSIGHTNLDTLSCKHVRNPQPFGTGISTHKPRFTQHPRLQKSSTKNPRFGRWCCCSAMSLVLWSSKVGRAFGISGCRACLLWSTGQCVLHGAYWRLQLLWKSNHGIIGVFGGMLLCWCWKVGVCGDVF